jgi:phasin family protein
VQQSIHFNNFSKEINMSFNTEQLVAAQQANLAAVNDVSKAFMSGFERLVELNMAASKAAFSESFSGLETLMSVKTPQDLLAVQASMGQPVYEKSVAYSRHLADIATTTGAQLAKTAEGKVAEAQKAFTAVLETSLKNAPAGSDAAVAAIKSAIEAGNTAMETAQKAAKQAAQTAESTFKAATNQAEAAVKSAMTKVKAKA